MIDDIFYEYNRNKLYGNGLSILDFGTDNQGFFFEKSNNLLSYSDDKAYEFNNQKEFDFSEDDGKDKSTSYKTINQIKKKKYHNLLLKIAENVTIKEDISLEFFSFDSIEEKIFKNENYKKNFSSNTISKFTKNEHLESKFLKKRELEMTMKIIILMNLKKM